MLLAALESAGVRTLKDLRQHTGAGEGCTACLKQIRRYFELHTVQSASSSLVEPICSVR
jgi:NAD(P)H-nitrite reductase large subunit